MTRKKKCVFCGKMDIEGGCFKDKFMCNKCKRELGDLFRVIGY